MGIKLRKCGLMKQMTAFCLVLALTFASPTVLAAETQNKSVIPMGNAIGINLKTDGVMVVGLSELTAENGISAPARDAGIVPGDVITQINSTSITSADDLKQAVANFDGKPVSIRVTRGGEVLQLTLIPNKNQNGVFELGVWLRDNMAGIGTMTFYDPETGVFGALGHAVSDVDTGVIIPLREGSVMHSVITDVIPGQAGTPGQLLGAFNSDDEIGNLTQNTENGIFGVLDEIDLTKTRDAIPVASESEIELGEATILSNISGSDVSEYTVEITRIYTGAEAKGRSMMLTVTDPDLIDKTGGIVQGMSGSPIIQNGKLIGAVTHVLINNPTKGYGIAIENMLDTARSGKKSLAA